jgi:hypothetical protein
MTKLTYGAKTLALKKDIKEFMLGHIIQWVMRAEDVLLHAPKMYTIKDEIELETYLMDEVFPKAVDPRLELMYIIDFREEEQGWFSIMGYHKDFDAPPRCYGTNRDGKRGYFPPMETIDFD